MWEFISSKISRSISEILDERLGVFCAEIMVIVGARILSFLDFRACGAHAFHGERDPVVSRRWLADMANAFRTSFYWVLV